MQPVEALHLRKVAVMAWMSDWIECEGVTVAQVKVRRGMMSEETEKKQGNL
jgi:hypothetical protein